MIDEVKAIQSIKDNSCRIANEKNFIIARKKKSAQKVDLPLY